MKSATFSRSRGNFLNLSRTTSINLSLFSSELMSPFSLLNPSSSYGSSPRWENNERECSRTLMLCWNLRTTSVLLLLLLLLSLLCTEVMWWTDADTLMSNKQIHLSGREVLELLRIDRCWTFGSLSSKCFPIMLWVLADQNDKTNSWASATSTSRNGNFSLKCLDFKLDRSRSFW